MEQKLTIEHLAPYLPYGLKMYIPKKYRFSGVNTDAKALELTGFQDDYIKLGRIGGFYPIGDFKPLLLPLSGLVPQLAEYLFDIGLYESIETATKWLEDIIDFKAQLSFRYNMCQKIFELHGDLFGLIPANLALDKSTYKLTE